MDGHKFSAQNMVGTITGKIVIVTSEIKLWFVLQCLFSTLSK